MRHSGPGCLAAILACAALFQLPGGGITGTAIAETLPAAPDYIVAEHYLEAAREAILPPVFPWSGDSERFIASADDPLITPTERAGFETTPDYDEVVAYLRRLADGSRDIEMIELDERTGEGRPFVMAVFSRAEPKDADGIRGSGKPTVFVEAGIHPGEVSGTDAGLMLARDLRDGGSLNALLDRVNFLFVPVVNIDGHARSGPYSRSNQRGPERTGWRSNSSNLNLNRDFAKLDSPEIRNIVRVMDAYRPELFVDLHETDGMNYQYDVTHCNNGTSGWSPASVKWLNQVANKHIDAELERMGHLPYVCIDGLDRQDPSAGFYPYYSDGPRYSNSYADARQIAGVLVEIHALKPYKRRVLGTYVYLRALLEVVAKKGEELRKAVAEDRAARPLEVTLSFKESDGPRRTVEFKSFRHERVQSPITGDLNTSWTNEPEVLTVPVLPTDKPDEIAIRPQAYYIPAQWSEVIDRLAVHGIEMTLFDEPREVEVEMYRMEDVAAERSVDTSHPLGPRLPTFEGRLRITGTPVAERRLVTYPPGSVMIETDQDLGTLAALLLEPRSPDSFLDWGFFNNVMAEVEEIEAYIMEPMARKMLEESPELAAEFEKRLATDSAFADNRNARLEWFYLRTPYADANRYLYPVGIEYPPQEQ